MSPESLEDSSGSGPQGQLSNETGAKDMKLGKKSDVWSLGCILYQMVYGRPPFAHIANHITRVLAVINRNYKIVYEDTGVGGVRVPPGLKRTMKRCLTREAAERPSVKELLVDDDPFIYPDADLPISMEILGQVITRVADRFRDPSKPAPTKEEIAEYPASFYAKIAQLLEGGV
jgi:serine/threonine-protein kinase TTK/MPS1